MTLPKPLNDDQLQRLAQWTRWNGWCALVMGIVTAITVVGLPLAWLPIWQWWVLKQSAEHLETVRKTGDAAVLAQALERSSFQFVLQVLYYLVMALYFSAIFAVLMALGVWPRPEA
jgi:hypothetical protein